MKKGVKQLEVCQFIIFNCMLPFIISFVVSCILNADMCLEIVGEIVYWFNKRVIEPVRFWIWKKTHKDELIQIQAQVQEMLSKEPTYGLPGWKTDEVNTALKSWVRAAESTGKMYREEIESWAESIAYAYSDREE